MTGRKRHVTFPLVITNFPVAGSLSQRSWYSYLTLLQKRKTLLHAIGPATGHSEPSEYHSQTVGLGFIRSVFVRNLINLVVVSLKASPVFKPLNSPFGILRMMRASGYLILGHLFHQCVLLPETSNAL